MPYPSMSANILAYNLYDFVKLSLVKTLHIIDRVAFVFTDSADN